MSIEKTPPQTEGGNSVETFSCLMIDIGEPSPLQDWYKNVVSESRLSMS